MEDVSDFINNYPDMKQNDLILKILNTRLKCYVAYSLTDFSKEQDDIETSSKYLKYLPQWGPLAHNAIIFFPSVRFKKYENRLVTLSDQNAELTCPNYRFYRFYGISDFTPLESVNAILLYNPQKDYKQIMVLEHIYQGRRQRDSLTDLILSAIKVP